MADEFSKVRVSPHGAEIPAHKRTILFDNGDELLVVRTKRFHGWDAEELARAIAHRLRAYEAMEKALRSIPDRYLEDMDAHTPAASRYIREARKTMGYVEPPKTHAEANARALAARK